MMGILDSEFESAFSAVQTQYPAINKTLARSFISKLKELVDRNHRRAYLIREEFPELLRYALNDCHIWPSKERKPYRVLAGKFFGRRGRIAKKARVVKQAPKKRPTRRRSPAIVRVEKNGQFAWKI